MAVQFLRKDLDTFATEGCCCFLWLHVSRDQTFRLGEAYHGIVDDSIFLRSAESCDGLE